MESMLERRNSSGYLLSPEIEASTPSLQTNASETSENNGFYRLKKDSQRRTTLSQVLDRDEFKICELWMQKVEADHKSSVAITKTELQILLRGLKDYIVNENEKKLEAIISDLKQSLNYEENAINHLHLALYSFQEAVVSVLRQHLIKPHWMFALDNLVKRAVQAAVTIFSPDMAANLATRDPSCYNDDESVHNQQHTSSTDNSQDKTDHVMQTPAASAQSSNGMVGEDEVSLSPSECVHVLRDIRESNRQYHRQSLELQKQSFKILQNISKEFAHIYLSRKRPR